MYVVSIETEYLFVNSFWASNPVSLLLAWAPIVIFPNREVLFTHLFFQVYWHGSSRGGDGERRFRAHKLLQKMELFAVLSRLRLGLSEEDIADRCGIHMSTFSRIILTWIRLLALMLPLLFPWPSKKTVQKYSPPSFSSYPNTCV